MSEELPADAENGGAPSSPRGGFAADELHHPGALQAAMERLAHLGSWSWRPASGEMRWSAGLYRLLGRSPERHPANYEGLIAALHPEDRPHFLLQLETALRRGGRLSLDHRIVRPDGAMREVHTEAEPGDDGWLAVVQERPHSDDTSLRPLVEALPDVFWLRSLDLEKTLYVSSSYEHLWGRSRAELYRNPRAFMEPIAVQDYPRLRRALECHARGCSYEAEYRVRHPRGVVRWVRERGYPVRDDRGELVAMATIASDITDWKLQDTDLREGARRSGRRMEELRAALGRVQSLFEAMPVAVLYCESDGRMRYANGAAARLFGWPAEELMALDFAAATFPAPEERGRFLEHLGRANGEWHDLSARLGSGERRELAWSFARQREGGSLAFAIDIQERRNMERRLRESEANFRSVYESNVVPFYFWRIDGAITGANDAWLRLVGYSREDLQSRHLDRTSLTPEEYRERDRRILEQQLDGRSVAEPVEKELLRKDGSRVPVLAGGALFPERHGGVGFAIDLRERKSREEELRRLNTELGRALSELKASRGREIQIEKLTALGTLAAGVAHELNNPLMSVMNYVDYVARMVGGEAAATLGRALQELERMRDLLSHMLAFAQPSQEPIRQLALAPVVQQALELLGPDLSARQITTTVDIDASLPELRAREQQLRQVLVSLLMNARDALEAAQEKRIRIAASCEESFIVLRIEDSGPGIPPAIRDRIFDPFFTTRPPGRGTGLGLSLSRSTMLELGGDLRFEAGATGGSVFILSFPVGGDAPPGPHGE